MQVVQNQCLEYLKLETVQMFTEKRAFYTRGVGVGICHLDFLL